MAASDIDQLVFAGGQLSITPSDVTQGSFPWGGTALGAVKNVVARVGRRVVWIKEEPFGPMPFDGLDLGEAWALTGSFRTFDEDAANKIFASVTTGGSTGSKGIAYPNGNAYRTGGLVSSLGVKLLLTPDDYENNRMLLLYNAVPLTDENGGMPFQRNEEWVVPFKFVGLPDSSNRTVAYMLREDLQLVL